MNDILSYFFCIKLVVLLILLCWYFRLETRILGVLHQLALVQMQIRYIHQLLISCSSSPYFSYLFCLSVLLYLSQMEPFISFSYLLSSSVILCVIEIIQMEIEGFEDEFQPLTCFSYVFQ